MTIFKTTLATCGFVVGMGLAVAAHAQEPDCEDTAFDSGDLYSLCIYPVPTECVDVNPDMTPEQWARDYGAVFLGVEESVPSIFIAHPEMGTTPNDGWAFMSEGVIMPGRRRARAIRRTAHWRPAGVRG